MDELVKKYLDDAKAIEQEIEEDKARNKKEERDKFLISLGFVKGVERRYSDSYGDPYNSWDKEKKQYYYDAQIPVEVTDEEFEQLKKYQAFHDAETDATGRHQLPDVPNEDPFGNAAENTLGTVNSIVFVIAIIGSIFLFFATFVAERPALMLDAAILFLASLVTWSVVKVYINISYNLKEIRKNTDKSKRE